MEEVISRHLGQKSENEVLYNPTLLVREERSIARKTIGLSENDKLPFVGYDTWNAYEISALQDNGMPVVAIGKFVYPATNKYIVESKSLKLYLNSFNMTKLGKYTGDVISMLHKTITTDLSNLLETNVGVTIFRLDKHYSAGIIKNTNKYVLEDMVDPVGTITIYAPSSEILQLFTGDPEKHREYISTGYSSLYQIGVLSRLLRSNCRVTKQQDIGDIFINMEGDKIPTAESLLRYIVSYRMEAAFHETVVEKIYLDLWNKFTPSKLFVKALYTRRGGIDINPQRASHEELISSGLQNTSTPHYKTYRQ